MDFSNALLELKAQQRVARNGWNASGQFVMFQKGYPTGIAINKNTADASGLAEGTVCSFSPYFMLMNAQGTFVPWTPTTGDLLAEDWFVIA